MIKGVVFDLDGTLLDSMHAWDHVGEQYLQRLHIQAEADLQETIADMSLKESAQYLKQHYHLNLSLEEIQKGIEDCVLHRYQKELQLKEGVLECISACQAKGWKLCVLTASSNAMAEAALKRCGIWDKFSFLMTCHDAGYSKSDEQIYETVLNKLRLDKKECLFIDDAYYAIAQIKRFGGTVYAVYDDANKKDWESICKISDQHFMSLSQWEV